MKRVILFLLLLATFTAGAQPSVTQSDVAIKFQYANVVAGGTADLVCDLTALSDQWNLWNGNDVAVGQVLWDNRGNRWEIMVVNSQGFLSANVDIRDINGGSLFPSGVGFVSQETANHGLSLLVADNAIGISPQLKARVETHNLLLIDALLGGGGADNLGNHIMTQNLQTGAFFISSDGDSNEGISIQADGVVYVEHTGTGRSLDVQTTTSLTALGMDVAWLVLQSTGDMLDGFGPTLDFFIEDGAASERIGVIGAVRNGADDQGKLIFLTNDGTAIDTRMEIDYLGQMKLNEYIVGAFSDTPEQYLALNTTQDVISLTAIPADDVAVTDAGDYFTAGPSLEDILAEIGSSAFSVASVYTSDATAAAGGVLVGEWYELGVGNIYGSVPGTIKRRLV